MRNRPRAVCATGHVPIDGLMSPVSTMSRTSAYSAASTDSAISGLSFVVIRHRRLRCDQPPRVALDQSADMAEQAGWRNGRDDVGAVHQAECGVAKQWRVAVEEGVTSGARTAT